MRICWCLPYKINVKLTLKQLQNPSFAKNLKELMEYYYLAIVVILLLTAIGDLIVGVANDAVNFLNSAIGAKVAKGWVILLISALGVFVGAAFSKGMMEIARSGVFQPQMFTFASIISVLIAVMLADIFLLDTFNSLGLPTSTTVSIIFELLGASIAVALIIIMENPETKRLASYINTAKALGIISGILLSVVIAFSVGTLIMYISRILFTFNYKKNLYYFGGLFGGIAITAFVYFLILKGLNGASFITPETYNLIILKSNQILLYSFIIGGIFLHILYTIFRIDPMKIIVLLGTFALAMAFAGNDLVNFIGVPLAGLDAYIYFKQSGLAADEITMEILKQPTQTSTWMLLIAGGIMVLTIIISKKARKVISTSVNLSRQEEGTENFSTSSISRLLVRFSVSTSKTIDKIIPQKLKYWIEERFTPYVEYPELPENEKPAFDAIRGAVNLLVAAALISIGTSLKLPLSTTYVTFMVAMGAALADRAWGRDSAVYRVTGVFTVISGWFVTALAAATISFVFAFIIHYFTPYGLFLVLLFVIRSVWKSYQRLKKDEIAESENIIVKNRFKVETIDYWIDHSSELVKSSLINMSKIYFVTINSLCEEDRKSLRKADEEAQSLNSYLKQQKKNIAKAITKLEEASAKNIHYYVQIIDFLREAAHDIQFITVPAYEHVNNNHKPLLEKQKAELNNISEKLSDFINHALHLVVDQKYGQTREVVARITEINQLIEGAQKAQIKRIKNGEVNTRNSMLFFTLLQETKNFVLNAGNALKSLRDFATDN